MGSTYVSKGGMSMGKFKYSKEEQEINNVLKYQDEQLKALTTDLVLCNI